ncbi:MAG: hypothetical protein R3C14_34520 [Caldilineaceae bacterium]
MDDFELDLGVTGAFAPTYAPTYASNDEACLDASERADTSSDEFWGDVRDYFGDESQTSFGDVFESGMDAWGDADRVEEICDTGGIF